MNGRYCWSSSRDRDGIMRMGWWWLGDDDDDDDESDDDEDEWDEGYWPSDGPPRFDPCRDMVWDGFDGERVVVGLWLWDWTRVAERIKVARARTCGGNPIAPSSKSGVYFVGGVRYALAAMLL